MAGKHSIDIGTRDAIRAILSHLDFHDGALDASFFCGIAWCVSFYSNMFDSVTDNSADSEGLLRQKRTKQTVSTSSSRWNPGTRVLCNA